MAIPRFLDLAPETSAIAVGGTAFFLIAAVYLLYCIRHYRTSRSTSPARVPWGRIFPAIGLLVIGAGWFAMGIPKLHGQYVAAREFASVDAVEVSELNIFKITDTPFTHESQLRKLMTVTERTDIDGGLHSVDEAKYFEMRHQSFSGGYLVEICRRDAPSLYLAAYMRDDINRTRADVVIPIQTVGGWVHLGQYHCESFHGWLDSVLSHVPDLDEKEGEEEKGSGEE